MLSDFDALVRRRSELCAWYELGSTVAAYDNKCHTLRVDTMKPTMVSFCGQQYAGAKNYHDAPGFFASAINTEIQKNIKELVKRAYEAELHSLNRQIESHRERILKELESH